MYGVIQKPELFLAFMSRLVTKPTKWHVRPSKTQISLGIRSGIKIPSVNSIIVYSVNLCCDFTMSVVWNLDMQKETYDKSTSE